MERHRPFTFYLPDRDKERLRHLAFKKDLSISDVVRTAIAEFFERSDEPASGPKGEIRDHGQL